MKIFSIVGGDKRNIALCALLRDVGHTVRLFGFPECEATLYEAINDADYVIGSVPCSHDGERLHAPMMGVPIFAEEMFRLMLPNQVFIAGMLKLEIIQIAQKYRPNLRPQKP